MFEPIQYRSLNTYIHSGIYSNHFEFGTQVSDMLDMPKCHKLSFTKCSHREPTEKSLCLPGSDGLDTRNRYSKFAHNFNKHQRGWKRS